MALRRISIAVLAACLLLTAGTLSTSAAAAAASDGVAHAVLFYSPVCPHCRELIRNELPPILSQYGDRLQVLAVDAAEPMGAKLFKNAVSRYDVPAPKRGVPAVVIGDHFLAGTTDVSEQLPMLAAQYLAAGGVGWPAVPGLSEATASGAVVTSSPSHLLAVTEGGDGILDRLARDRWGNTIALILLAGMLAAIVTVVVRAVGASRAGRAWSDAATRQDARGWRLYAGVVLIALGLGISGYLSYAAITDAALLCGPLSACDAVQQSSYAKLFGAIPVAYVGLAGYVLIAASFAVSVLASGAVARAGALALLVLTLCGTLFSIYLTTLEPFVLGATCVWCLGSATVMTLLFLLAAGRVGLGGQQVREPAAQAASSSA